MSSKQQQNLFPLSALVFLSTTALLILHIHQRKKTNDGNDIKKVNDVQEQEQQSITDTKRSINAIEMAKDEVIRLRKHHFMQSVSVSYANSGPLMIMSVSRQKEKQNTKQAQTKCHRFCIRRIIIH